VLGGRSNSDFYPCFVIDLHYDCILLSPEKTGVVLVQYNICRNQYNSWMSSLDVSLSICKRYRSFGEHVEKQRCHSEECVSVYLVPVITQQE